MVQAPFSFSPPRLWNTRFQIEVSSPLDNRPALSIKPHDLPPSPVGRQTVLNALSIPSRLTHRGRPKAPPVGSKGQPWGARLRPPFPTPRPLFPPPPSPCGEESGREQGGRGATTGGDSTAQRANQRTLRDLSLRGVPRGVAPERGIAKAGIAGPRDPVSLEEKKKREG